MAASASASSSAAQARVLECGICLEAFSATIAARQPYVFTACGHSVCKECAASLQQKGLSKCSFCNTAVRQPPVKNHALMDQLEMFARLLPAAKTLELRCEGQRHLKDSEGPPAATFYCPVCKKNCCAGCKIFHDEAHGEALMPVTDRPQQSVMCKEDQAPCLLYCLDCAGTPMICKQCLVEHGSHHGHKAEKIADAEARRRGELEALLARLAEKVGQAEASSRAVGQVADELGDEAGKQGTAAGGGGGTLAAAERQVREGFERIMAALQQRRDELLREVQAIGTNCRQQIDEHMRGVGTFLSSAHAAREAAQFALGCSGLEFAGRIGQSVAAVQACVAQAVKLEVSVRSEVFVGLPELGIATYGSVANGRRPGPPVDVEVVGCTGAEIQVVFAPPAGRVVPPVLSYVAVASLPDGQEVKRVTVTAAAAAAAALAVAPAATPAATAATAAAAVAAGASPLSVTLTELQADTEYAICVAAVNAFGQGALSDAVRGRSSLPWSFGYVTKPNISGNVMQYRKHGRNWATALVEPVLPMDRVSYMKTSVAGDNVMLGVIGNSRPEGDGRDDSTAYIIGCEGYQWVAGDEQPLDSSFTSPGTILLKFDPLARRLCFRQQGTAWTHNMDINIALSTTWYFTVMMYDTDDIQQIEPLGLEDVGW